MLMLSIFCIILCRILTLYGVKVTFKVLFQHYNLRCHSKIICNNHICTILILKCQSIQLNVCTYCALFVCLFVCLFVWFLNVFVNY